MDYRIYNPTVTEQTVVDPYDNAAGLTYVSNSSLAYWQGRYWAVMDGNVGPLYEGAAGQQIWLTTSADAATWGAPYQPFRNSSYCNNPMTGGSIEWQPSLVVVGDELWCTWSGANGYVSKLTSPTGKWTNYRFEFLGQTVSLSTTITGSATGGRALSPTIDGISDWLPFFSQNPIVLSSGAAACPLTLYSATQSTQTTASSSFTKALKYNALLLADGNSWSLSLVDTQQWGDFIAWEPFVVENPVGHVYVYTRNLDARVVDEDFMLVSVSTDGGHTFSPAESANMLVPSTRGFARQVSDKRWVMVHNDHPQNSTRAVTQALSALVRRNGAVFVSRRGVTDFVPGINFSGDSVSANYPQFIVGPDADTLLINYTDNIGGPVRRSFKLVTVNPLPDDDYAYVHPRSIGIYSPVTAYDPPLVSGTPPYYSFNGVNRLWSADPLTVTSGLTYTAWVRWDRDGTVLMDSRQNSTDVSAFGQVFFAGGSSINGLNVLHSLTLNPFSPVFAASTFDPSAGKITVYACQGGASFTTKTGYYRSFEVLGQPADGDTITVNATTYTFRTTPTLTNDIEIGEGYYQTIDNAITKIKTNSMLAAGAGANGRIIMMRSDLTTFTISSTSSAITADTTTPLNGGPVSFGKASVTSGLWPFAGRIYEARVYDSVLTDANITNLYNAKAASFGYSTISGTSTAPSSPLFFLNPASPNATIESAGDVSTCEVVDSSTLRINGETSASVELPYSVTQLTLRFKLGASPTGTERYTIATFGGSRRPVRLYIDADNPTKLYANDVEVLTIAAPTSYTSIGVTVSTNKITIGTVERDFSGRPRCYLGDAYPEGLLTPDKYVQYDISEMNASRR